MRRPRLLILLVIALSVAVYLPSVSNGFTFDDQDVVRVPNSFGFRNEMVAEIQPLARYYTSHYGEGTGSHRLLFRPTAKLSFALVHAVSPKDPSGDPAVLPWPQHLVNVLLHGLGVWLTFAMLVAFAVPRVPALLGALVFGLHAVRSEVVAGMVGRAELLAFVCGAGALLAYVAALRRGAGWSRSGYLGLCAVSMFLSITSKESSVAWAVFLPLCVSMLRQKSQTDLPDLRQQILPWSIGVGVPLLCAALLYWSLWLAFKGEYIAPSYRSNPLWYLDGTARVANGVIILAYGLYKVLLPLHLSCDYGAEVFELVDGFGAPRFWLAAVALLAVLIAGIRFARRWPLLFLAVAAFFGFSFVASNIPRGIGTVFGERLYYTPALALSLAVAFLAERLPGGNPRRVAIVALALWSCACAWLVVQRSFAWRSNETLFTADAVAQPRSIAMHLNRAGILTATDRVAFKRELDLAHAVDASEPGTLLQLARYSIEQPDEAMRLARLGLASKHADLWSFRPDLHLVLAKSLAAKSDFTAAERHHREAMAAAPTDNPSYAMGLAGFFHDRGRVEDALQVCRDLLVSHPKYMLARDRLLREAQARSDLSRVEELVAGGLRIDKNSVIVLAHQGILAMRRGDSRLGLEVLSRSVPRMTQVADTAEFWCWFAEALLAQGRPRPVARIVAAFARVPLPPHLQKRFADIARRAGG